MNELSIFNYEGREVRTVLINEQPWWVAKDVCDILGIANHSDALSGIRANEKDEVGITDPIGREQGMTVINEPGLYRLIFKSRKPQAEAFKTWVVSEVLPSIRKTGSYSVAQRDPITEVDRVAAVLNQLMPVLGGKLQEITATVETHAERLAAVEDRQAQIDPQEIERRMVVLHDLKDRLIDGTRKQMVPVNHRTYWDTLRKHIGIASFQNRAALTVESMDNAVDFAKRWCFSRGVVDASLFATEAPVEAPQL